VHILQYKKFEIEKFCEKHEKWQKNKFFNWQKTILILYLNPLSKFLIAINVLLQLNGKGRKSVYKLNKLILLVNTKLYTKY